MTGLRRDAGLGLIVAWKLAKGGALSLLAIALGFGFLSGGSVRVAHRLAQTMEHDFSSTLLRAVAAWLAAHVNPFTIGATTLLLALDGSLSLVQGIGLAGRHRWAAWLTVVPTSLFIPVEIWRLVVQPQATRVLVLVANVAIVAYLAARVRRKNEWVETAA